MLLRCAMNTRRKFDQDYKVAIRSITEIMDSLTKKMPSEMVALVLLQYLKGLLEDLTDFDQWELLKGDLLSVSLSFLLSSFTSLWHFTTLTRCPNLVDHITPLKLR